MKHVIKFNGEELLSKSEVIKVLGFSQLRRVDFFIEKLLSRNQAESFEAKRGYSNG
jgi:hypothetical protein